MIREVLTHDKVRACSKEAIRLWKRDARQGVASTLISGFPVLFSITKNIGATIAKRDEENASIENPDEDGGLIAKLQDNETIVYDFTISLFYRNKEILIDSAVYTLTCSMEEFSMDSPEWKEDKELLNKSLCKAVAYPDFQFHSIINDDLEVMEIKEEKTNDYPPVTIKTAGVSNEKNYDYFIENLNPHLFELVKDFTIYYKRNGYCMGDLYKIFTVLIWSKHCSLLKLINENKNGKYGNYILNAVWELFSGIGYDYYSKSSLFDRFTYKIPNFKDSNTVGEMLGTSNDIVNVMNIYMELTKGKGQDGTSFSSYYCDDILSIVKILNHIESKGISIPSFKEVYKFIWCFKGNIVTREDGNHKSYRFTLTDMFDAIDKWVDFERKDINDFANMLYNQISRIKGTLWQHSDTDDIASIIEAYLKDEDYENVHNLIEYGVIEAREQAYVYTVDGVLLGGKCFEHYPEEKRIVMRNNTVGGYKDENVYDVKYTFIHNRWPNVIRHVESVLGSDNEEVIAMWDRQMSLPHSFLKYYPHEEGFFEQDIFKKGE